MNTKHQSGSAHLIIIISLVVLVLGALGVIFWQNFINKPASTNTEATTTSMTEQSNPSISLSEWSLKATYDKDVLGTLTYAISDNTLTFSSSVVESDVLPCAGLTASSWGISKAKSGDKDLFGVDVAESWKKIGDTYYARIYPQSSCENKATQAGYVDAAYSSLFDSLVQVQ